MAGPFGPLSRYLSSRSVRSLISASTSALGHLDELAGVKVLSPPLSLVDTSNVFMGVIVNPGAGAGAGGRVICCAGVGFFRGCGRGFSTGGCTCSIMD
ncbi:hypothetical protein ACJIZ3_024682 [Penstemon smallii]|uniref:Uncharacterized protein n=1 Tax=Penstemon smallii TaxID=265156 RepID=A0ABD3TU91_9LAMI